MERKLRKHIVAPSPEVRTGMPGDAIDIIVEAEVLVTSEAEGFPLDNIVDSSSGPGSSQWVAGTTGPQTLVFKFDAPQHISGINYEIEENETARTQEVSFEVSSDAGAHFREVLRQEYNFSPDGSTYEREELTFDLPGVTQLRMVIKPDKGNRECRAKLNSIVFRRKIA